MSAASTITPAPTRTAPQHIQALAQANRVRLARAALKRAVASGERDIDEVILECPWESESMPISELLAAQRRWGETRSRKFLAELGLKEKKRIGSLVPRQRLLLASALRAKNTGTPAPEAEAPRVLVAA